LTRKILINFANLVEIPYRDLIIDVKYSVYILVDLNKFKLEARGFKRKADKIVEESQKIY